jgi:ketosteroid isomerase-like protein
MRSRLMASLIPGFLIAGCAALPSADRDPESLLRVDREWAAAAAEGKDLDRIVGYWSDDATVFPAGAPVIHGKAAIRDYVRQSLAIPGFHITWHTDQVTISADGTMAYASGVNAITVPGPDGKPITLSGRGVTVWRRTAAGEWKCVVDIWNAGATP